MSRRTWTVALLWGVALGCSSGSGGSGTGGHGGRRDGHWRSRGRHGSGRPRRDGGWRGRQRRRGRRAAARGRWVERRAVTQVRPAQTRADPAAARARPVAARAPLVPRLSCTPGGSRGRGGRRPRRGGARRAAAERARRRTAGGGAGGGNPVRRARRVPGQECSQLRRLPHADGRRLPFGQGLLRRQHGRSGLPEQREPDERRQRSEEPDRPADQGRVHGGQRP